MNLTRAPSGACSATTPPFSDPERGVIFDLVEDRSQAAAELGFSLMSARMRAAIETVVVDCFPPYRKAPERWLPWARIVLDKFHAMRMVDDCAHRVRTRASRKRATNLPNNRSGHQFDRRVRRLRWAFSKRASTLTDDDRSKLFAVFETYPEVGLAWLLKEEFASIYDASDRDEAARRLQMWKHYVMVSGIGEFIRTWRRTLSAWEEQDPQLVRRPGDECLRRGNHKKDQGHQSGAPTASAIRCTIVQRSYWLVVIDEGAGPTTVLRVEPEIAG